MTRREIQKKMSGGWERGSKDDWRRPSKNDRTLGINELVVLLLLPPLPCFSPTYGSGPRLYLLHRARSKNPLDLSPFAQLSLTGKVCFLGFILVLVHIISRHPFAHFGRCSYFSLHPLLCLSLLSPSGLSQMKLRVVISFLFFSFSRCLSVLSKKHE